MLVAEGGAPFGLIGIDFSARRRNRVNGRIVSARGDGWTLAVDEAFGNCPKYIAPRKLLRAGAIRALMDLGAWTESAGLDDAARAMIARAEAFFVATRARTAWTFPIAAGRPVSRASRLKAC